MSTSYKNHTFQLTLAKQTLKITRYITECRHKILPLNINQILFELTKKGEFDTHGYFPDNTRLH